MRWNFPIFEEKKLDFNQILTKTWQFLTKVWKFLTEICNKFKPKYDIFWPKSNKNWQKLKILTTVTTRIKPSKSNQIPNTHRSQLSRRKKLPQNCSKRHHHDQKERKSQRELWRLNNPQYQQCHNLNNCKRMHFPSLNATDKRNLWVVFDWHK